MWISRLSTDRSPTDHTQLNRAHHGLLLNRREEVTLEAGTAQTADRNDVALRGRLAAAPQVRELPSGDEVATLRLVVGRDPRDGPARADGRRAVTVDTLDCSAWRAQTRRLVLRWQPGDVVEVEGSLRRRFYRAGGAPVSRWDVLIRRARRVARAPAR